MLISIFYNLKTKNRANKFNDYTTENLQNTISKYTYYLNILYLFISNFNKKY